MTRQNLPATQRVTDRPWSGHGLSLICLLSTTALAGTQTHAQGLERYPPERPLSHPPIQPVRVIAARASQPELPVAPSLDDRIETEVNRQLGTSAYPAMARTDLDTAQGSGAITIKRTPVVIGTVTLQGAPITAAPDKALTVARLGLHKGQVLDVRQFTYDLAALNRYPFRQTQAVVTENAATGASDIDLKVTRTKPWEIYAGFKYLGSRDFTSRRYVLGGSAGNLLGRDSLITFQAVGSPEVALHFAPHPKFKDVTLTYSLPVSLHQQFEASVDVGEFNFHFAPSTYRIDDLMFAAGVRRDREHFDQPNVTSDIRYGIEAKNEQVYLFTPGQADSVMSTEVYQIYAGYHRAWAAGPSHSDFDVLAHLSPGGLDPGNTDVQFRRASDGRQTTARYAWLAFTYDRVMPALKGMTWHSQVIGQLSTTAIPYSEQGVLGGPAYVRGYLFIDGSFDNLLVVRNELGRLAKNGGNLQYYVFGDLGIGRDLGLHLTNSLASVGVGSQFALGHVGNLRLEAVHTLRPGQFTARGADALTANLVFKY